MDHRGQSPGLCDSSCWKVSLCFCPPYLITCVFWYGGMLLVNEYCMCKVFRFYWLLCLISSKLWLNQRVWVKMEQRDIGKGCTVFLPSWCAAPDSEWEMVGVKWRYKVREIYNNRKIFVCCCVGDLVLCHSDASQLIHQLIKDILIYSDPSLSEGKKINSLSCY